MREGPFRLRYLTDLTCYLYFFEKAYHVLLKGIVFYIDGYTELINDNLFLDDSCTFYIQFTDKISNLETQT